MALVTCDFFSDVLGLSTTMTVVLPQRTHAQIGMEGTERTGATPTLYLLHGLSDDATTWSRRTSIERYATELGIAVVMPQVAKSFYSDEVYGDPYWTFLTDELPSLARSFFHLSDRREDTFVAGLSMGGYGAFQWALRKPQDVAAAASLSGALDVASLHEAVLERGEGFEVLRKVYGDTSVRGSDSDLLHLLSTADPATLPALYQMCGTEDFLLQSNLDFRDTAARHGVPLTVDLRPGDHSWGLWDTTIQDVLAWLPLAGSTQDPATQTPATQEP